VTYVKEIKEYSSKYFFAASHFLAGLNAEFPICYLGGSGDFEIAAVSFSEAKIENILQLNSRSFSKNQEKLVPFSTGYIGVLPYSSNFETTIADAKIYRVNQSVVFDKKNRKVFLCGEASPDDTWNVNALDVLEKVAARSDLPESSSGIKINPVTTESNYLQIASAAIKQIKEGRFYQINLLRYFSVPQPPSRLEILCRLNVETGPQSCLFDFDNYGVASFSPESFFSLKIKNSRWKIRTRPIKGTIERGKSKAEDAENKAALETSSKDNSELHIIVDLMRNDLNSICESQSVKVESAGEVQSFSKVHHLVADISGDVQDKTNIEEILKRLMPGGSITGAPKIEVMKAIGEFEKRERSFFMGSAYYLGDDGSFDSSILIRTLIKNQSSEFEYAAGSGIVINSNPQNEMEEIGAKCRIITDSVPSN